MIKLKFSLLKQIIRFIPGFALIFIVNPFFGQQVSITGSAPGRIHALVRIICFDDQFSRVEKTIASTYTDQQGNFSLNLEVKETDFVYLAVGLKKSEFYLSPGASFQFRVNPDTSSQKGSIFDELPLQFDYTADDGGLSDAIEDFNVGYNTFLYKNADKIYYGRNKEFINDYERSVQDKFKSVKNRYFEDYMRYSFASLEWSSKKKDNDSIVKEYLCGNPILYNNIQYTEFFTEFFKTYFTVEKIFDYNELVDAINNGTGMQTIESLIKKKDYFKGNPQLTELLAVVLVAKKYYNPDIIRKRVLALLGETNQNSKYPQIKRIAGNFIKKLLTLEYGTQAPVFSLKDIDNKEHSLSDYRGKFLLLSFIKPDCKVCLDHLHLLDELQKKYATKLQNISIVYGDGFDDVVHFASDRNFDWPFLKLEDNILLLEAYNIRAYPSYVIINPDGTISMATAPMPDENLDIYIQRQIKRFEQTKKGE